MNSTLKTNEKYWNDNAIEWFGCTALPEYGVRFPTEDKLKLLGNLAGMTVLDIGCGSGHSLKYCAERGASQLWGMDLSQAQLSIASDYLKAYKHKLRLVQSPMETCSHLPRQHYDLIYSIYAIGWTSDLEATFNHVYDLLKPGGAFIFSWQHPMHRSIQRKGDQWVLEHSYHKEDFYLLEIDKQTVELSSRKLSTYINALIKAGLTLDYVSESNALGCEPTDLKGDKARMMPLSFVMKAIKK